MTSKKTTPSSMNDVDVIGRECFGEKHATVGIFIEHCLLATSTRTRSPHQWSKEKTNEYVAGFASHQPPSSSSQKLYRRVVSCCLSVINVHYY